MNNIKDSAIKLLRATNGVITYSSLKKYITGKGFVLVDMNTEKGDRVLKNLCIYERCIENDGKTISADGVNCVVLDDTLGAEDKVRVLLHEICHINNHYDGEIIRDATRIQRENEAEAFAYEVVRLQKHKILYSRRIQIITVCVIVSILFAAGISLQIVPGEEHPSAAAKAYSEVTSAIVSDTDDKACVYTLRKSDVYHKETCYHLNINNAVRLTASEAEKMGLRPCKDCSPDKE